MQLDIFYYFNTSIFCLYSLLFTQRCSSFPRIALVASRVPYFLLSAYSALCFETNKCLVYPLAYRIFHHSQMEISPNLMTELCNYRELGMADLFVFDIECPSCLSSNLSHSPVHTCPISKQHHSCSIVSGGFSLMEQRDAIVVFRIYGK